MRNNGYVEFQQSSTTRVIVRTVFCNGLCQTVLSMRNTVQVPWPHRGNVHPHNSRPRNVEEKDKSTLLARFFSLAIKYLFLGLDAYMYDGV